MPITTGRGGGSLFAADYTVSASPSLSNRSSDSPGLGGGSLSGSTTNLIISPMPRATKPLEVVFPASDISAPPTPPKSPLRKMDAYSPPPTAVTRKKSTLFSRISGDSGKEAKGSSSGYMTYETCMEGESCNSTN